MLLSVLAAANADYLKTTRTALASCSGPALTTVYQLTEGCSPVSGSPGLYSSLACSNSSFGVNNFYLSSTCTGAVAATSAIGGFSFGCTAGVVSGSNGQCVTGTYSAPTGVYLSRATCAARAPFLNAT